MQFPNRKMYLLCACCWLLVLNSVQGALGQPSEVLIHIAAQFKEWDFIVHINDEPELFKMPMHNDTGNPLTIFNYSQSSQETFARPFAKQCVHFVMYENYEFRKFAKRYGNIDDCDVILFLTETLPTHENYSRWYDSGVDHANSVFVVGWTHALAIFFYSAPDISVYTEEVKRDRNGIPQLSKSMNAYTNFKGFPLKIGYTNCVPYVYDQDMHDDNHDDIVGVEFEVLKVVSKKLNMTPVMDNYSSKLNARYALIEAVNTSVLHFGIGCLSNNIRRNAMVSFSASLQFEPHITVYASVDGRYGPAALYVVIAPLKLDVWIYCFVALVVISILAQLLASIHPSPVPFDSTLIPTQILLEQSTFIPSHSGALRFGLVIWILVGYALSSSYKSKLTAALIMPEMNEPNTLNELLDQDYHFISPATDSTYLIELLQYSSDPVENRIGRSIEDTKVVCEALDRALDEVSAVIEERTVVRYMLWNYCKYNMTKREMSSLRRLKADTTVNGHAWAMPRGAPFKETVSMVLERMKSHGLVEKWYKAYNLSQPLAIPNSRVKAEPVALRVTDLVSAWIIVGIGATVSACVFLVEQFLRATKHAHFKRPLIHTDSRTRLLPVFDAIGNVDAAASNAHI